VPKIKMMEQDNVLNRLVPRLKKIGITIEMAGNYPWIYLEKVNGMEKRLATDEMIGVRIPVRPLFINFECSQFVNR